MIRDSKELSGEGVLCVSGGQNHYVLWPGCKHIFETICTWINSDIFLKCKPQSKAKVKMCDKLNPSAHLMPHYKLFHDSKFIVNRKVEEAGTDVPGQLNVVWGSHRTPSNSSTPTNTGAFCLIFVCRFNRVDTFVQLSESAFDWREAGSCPPSSSGSSWGWQSDYPPGNRDLKPGL